jgi:thymidine phosphorylase
MVTVNVKESKMSKQAFVNNCKTINGLRTVSGRTNRLRVRRLGIDTYQEAVIYMREDCHICRSEGFEAHSRILVTHDSVSIIATLNVLKNGLLSHGEAGLSEAAWRLLEAIEGDYVELEHRFPLESLGRVRAKVYGKHLDPADYLMIISDIAAGRYSDVELSAFISACAGERMATDEIISLTKAMVDTGERLFWKRSPIMDKHCVGGLPGNRTSLIVVPIVAAFGLTMPKTSSRAITSPAGTADTMETLAPVNLELREMQKVVEREGGCIVWGGSVKLSRADDVLIRVERSLDIDSEGQMVASVLSKKVAAGSTHVVIDIPVGETAKVRSFQAGGALSKLLSTVGNAVGLDIQATISDGSQPVGRGIGPALEARDVLSVLQNEQGAPEDLRERALILAGQILEMSKMVAQGQGSKTAAQILTDGVAWKKFLAICESQGGYREPPRAEYTHGITAAIKGVVTAIDNRKLARVAKLTGAPKAKAAGLQLHASISTAVEAGQPLYTLHAETIGELDYAVEYAKTNGEIITIAET